MLDDVKRVRSEHNGKLEYNIEYEMETMQLNEVWVSIDKGEGNLSYITSHDFRAFVIWKNLNKSFYQNGFI